MTVTMEQLQAYLSEGKKFTKIRPSAFISLTGAYVREQTVVTDAGLMKYGTAVSNFQRTIETFFKTYRAGESAWSHLGIGRMEELMKSFWTTSVTYYGDLILEFVLTDLDLEMKLNT